MTTELDHTVEQKNSTGKTALRIVLGLGLLIPASLACLGGLLVPTVNTLILSLQSSSLVTREARFVGMENYAHLFQDTTFSGALGFTLLLMLVRVLVVALVPVLLALAVNEFGRTVRIPARVLFTIPLAMFAPVATALIWATALNPNGGLVSSVLRSLGQAPQSWLTNAGQAKGALLFVDALSTFGLACGVGLIFYLAALRGSGEQTPSWTQVRAPLAASWVMGLLGTLALSLQSFALSFALTGGGPTNATMTLILYQYNQAFRFLQFGVGATIAALVLLALMLLGLAVGLIAVLTGLRLEMVPWGKRSRLFGEEGPPGRGRIVAVVLLVAMLVVSLGICSLSAAPTLWNALNSLKTNAEIARPDPPLFPSSPSLAAYTELGKRLSIGQVFANSLLPALPLVLLLQIPIAVVGALGIAAVRPLGRWSEWLLLLFSPWLFVTVGPLSVAAYQNLASAHMLDTAGALAPPIMLNVPMLFVLTLFFKGQELQWRAARAQGQGAAATLFTRLILPSLPLVVLLMCMALLISAHDLLWPLLVAVRPENMTISLALLRLRSQFVSASPVASAAVVLFGLPTFLFFFLVFGTLQSLYLDRLALTTYMPNAAEGPTPQDR